MRKYVTQNRIGVSITKCVRSLWTNSSSKLPNADERQSLHCEALEQRMMLSGAEVPIFHLPEQSGALIGSVLNQSDSYNDGLWRPVIMDLPGDENWQAFGGSEGSTGLTDWNNYQINTNVGTESYYSTDTRDLPLDGTQLSFVRDGTVTRTLSDGGNTENVNTNVTTSITLSGQSAGNYISVLVDHSFEYRDLGNGAFSVSVDYLVTLNFQWSASSQSDVFSEALSTIAFAASGSATFQGTHAYTGQGSSGQTVWFNSSGNGTSSVLTTSDTVITTSIQSDEMTLSRVATDDFDYSSNGSFNYSGSGSSSVVNFSQHETNSFAMNDSPTIHIDYTFDKSTDTVSHTGSGSVVVDDVVSANGTSTTDTVYTLQANGDSTISKTSSGNLTTASGSSHDDYREETAVGDDFTRFRSSLREMGGGRSFSDISNGTHVIKDTGGVIETTNNGTRTATFSVSGDLTAVDVNSGTDGDYAAGNGSYHYFEYGNSALTASHGTAAQSTTLGAKYDPGAAAGDEWTFSGVAQSTYNEIIDQAETTRHEDVEYGFRQTITEADGDFDNEDYLFAMNFEETNRSTAGTVDTLERIEFGENNKLTTTNQTTGNFTAVIEGGGNVSETFDHQLRSTFSDPEVDVVHTLAVAMAASTPIVTSGSTYSNWSKDVTSVVEEAGAGAGGGGAGAGGGVGGDDPAEPESYEYEHDGKNLQNFGYVN